MPADRRRFTDAHARASGRHTTINISGGRGGTGGDGYRNGTGGAGGHGMGPTLNVEVSTRSFTMNNSQQDERGIQILHHAVAMAAIHDSAESYPQPKCHPETRTQMIRDLYRWALDEGASRNILWLHGPAGAGKSAIMQTLAGQLRDAGKLGGSFFFKRSHATRGNARTLFATIAYQLALSIPGMRTWISEAVQNDPSVVFRSIATQFEILISAACRTHTDRGCIPILIDGLDECDGQSDQVEVLRTIGNLPFSDPIPLRFIIASRPEPHIQEVFDSSFHPGQYRSFNVEQSFHDVHKYLWDEFSRIHREHRTMADIPSPWPSTDVLWELVWKSSGHFIYAATIIKFINDKNYRPTQRLAMVLGNSSQGLPFGALDQLYMDILSSAPRQSELVPILCAIANFQLTISEMDQLFEFTEGETRLLLRGLHSVLQLPSKDNDCISTHHASFLDFLNDCSRSHNFYIGSLDHRMDLARSFLRVCADRDHSWNWFRDFGSRCPREHLIPFLTSLPPSIELCPFIAHMDPDHIFNLNNENFEAMLSWLKRIPSVPQGLIELWEDYIYMVPWEMFGDTRLVKHIDSPSSELCQVLVASELLHYVLHNIPHLLDITWDELRTIICSFRPSITETGYWAISREVPVAIIPWENQRWICRDIAVKCIHRIVNPPGDRRGNGIKFDEWDNLAKLLKYCPPCDALYHEFQRIPRPVMKSYFEDGSSWYLAKRISRWLESFSDPTLELAVFWKQEILPLANRVHWFSI